MSSLKSLVRGHRSVAVAALVSALSLAPTCAVRAAVPDSAKELGGIRLGMTMDEVKAAAAAHQPPLTIIRPATEPVPGQGLSGSGASAGAPGQPDKPGTTVVYAHSYTGNRPLDYEAFEVYFPPPPVPRRVVAIRRFMGFSKDKMPTEDYLQTSLREKFGGPPEPGFMSWAWKPTGALIHGPESAKCLGADFIADRYQVGGAAAFAFDLKSETCGLVAAAGTRGGAVAITIVDVANLAEALKKAKAVEADAAKKKADAAAAQAAKNRPKL
jgi:hypothetical protein